MKVSLEWLKDYVQVEIPAKKLAERLTMAGLEVVRLNELDGDTVMEIEVTTNRPDCLSVLGIAREVAAITGKKLKLPAAMTPQRTTALLRQPSRPLGKDRLRPKLRIEDGRGCRRYVGWLLTEIEAGPSPEWLARRLEVCGIRPVNNVVDITNFCLLETGQPFHAFDYAKLEGGEVVVRRAKKGEEIITIDGVRRPLDEETLVIADAARPVALAGIMGGQETEISSSTKMIFLESAHFDPALIRRTSQRLGLNSESSYRFERGVNLENVFVSSCRVLDMMGSLIGSRAIGKPLDLGQKRLAPRLVNLRLERLNRILGINISSIRVRQILGSLQFDVRPYGEARLQVAIPSFRRDVSREIDLIEEVARHFGYDKIPTAVSTGPPLSADEVHPLSKPALRTAPSFRTEEKKKISGREKLSLERVIRQTLTSQGMYEVITYSLISRELLTKANFPEEETVSVENPLSSEQAILRPTQIPGILRVILNNLNQKWPDQKVFELGRVFREGKGDQIQEKTYLTLALTGRRFFNWQMNPGKCDSKILKLGFFDLKGIIETLLGRLGITGYSFQHLEHPLFQEGRAAALILEKNKVGSLGEVKRAILDRFDIASEVYVGEVDLEEIIPRVELERKFQPFIRYPSVVRDMAVVLNQDVLSETVLTLIRKTGSNLVKEVKLFDEYRGKQIPSGKRSLAYSIEYQAPDRTLTEEEVEKLHQQIRQKLAQELKAEFR